MSKESFEIQVTDNYRLVKDSFCYTLWEYKKIVNKRTEEERYEWVCCHKYFPRLDQAVHHIIDRCFVSSSEAVHLQQFLDQWVEQRDKTIDMIQFPEGLKF